MGFEPRGRHLIAGEWVAGAEDFASDPASGPSHRFAVADPGHVDDAVRAAEAAFESYGWTLREARAEFLEAIADEIEARGAAITEIAGQETGLPAARLEGERGRTTFQLRLFAAHIRQGDYLDRRVDRALPDRKPAPRPDLRLMQRPVGPVVVFGASNFPLAFSTAGGDTASALAAGCPVVVKGHPAHPGTGEIVAEAIHAARGRLGLHPGVFSLIQGGLSHEVGAALVTHPLIRAVGFTGSLGGGRALFDLCCARPEPIPFFGELGSVNPVFVLPAALAARGPALARDWAGSLTLGAGQFCTNPGNLVLVDGPEAEAFLDAAAAALTGAPAQVMLTEGIADAYRRGREGLAAAPGVEARIAGDSAGRSASADLLATTGEAMAETPALGHEVFGPVGLAVRVRDAEALLAHARGLEGQLTTTLLMDEADTALAARLLPILERKAGRILVNGMPTGVEVADAMVHGGPYPASTNFGATSVGTMAIRRFLRPVCYQNLPEALLPEDLR